MAGGVIESHLDYAHGRSRRMRPSAAPLHGILTLSKPKL